MGEPSYRGDNCGTPCRKVCSLCFGLVWLLLIGGTVLVHLGVIALAPPLEDLPYNLEKGFDDVLGFAHLGDDAQQVQDAAEAALLLCNVLAGSCTLPYTPTGSSDSTQHKNTITAAFSNSLDTIERVATDPYFGTDSLNETATDLQRIMQEMDNIPDGTTNCVYTTSAYCEIYNAAVDIHSQLGTVNAQIDDFTGTEIMNDWKDNGDKIVYLHALPYFAVVSMLLFTLFWKKDAACCMCCGGSKLGCVVLILHSLFWLVAFAISSIFAGAGFAVRYGADKISIESGTFRGDPKLKDLLDHIETEYADFWDLVFKDLVDGCKTFWAGFIVIELILLLIIGYGLSICCCKVYREKGEKKESS